MPEPDLPLPETSTKFGQPEHIFKPSPSQTLVAMLAFAALALVCFLASVGVIKAPATRPALIYLPLCLISVGFCFWVWRFRRWRLLLCPNGIIQIKTWTMDELSWSLVREVVIFQHVGLATPHKLIVQGNSSRLVVQPFNFSTKRELYDRVIEAARKRDIPIRTEWSEPSSD